MEISELHAQHQMVGKDAQNKYRKEGEGREGRVSEEGGV
jgi:hypothetical protein